MKKLIHWSSFLFQNNFCFLLILILFKSQPALAQTKPARKSIDNLTTQELAAYEHAIQILKDRSAENPYDKEGYAWQAWVHNVNSVKVPKVNTMKQGNNNATLFYETASKASYADFTFGYPGMCEHGKDIFFWWHRAQFFYFESILQQTDPGGNVTDSKGNTGPSTKDLRVPYWNFSKRPSGVRFPLAFENKNSVLYHEGRNTDPVTFPFTSKFLIAHQLYNLAWPEFAGYPNATNGGYGNFESMVHNPMHSTYIGGDMDDPSTAAYDPIFYSFHSYIDLIFEKYMEVNAKVNPTSTDYFLRGELPSKYNLPNYQPGAGDRPTMGQAKLYTDISKLGYSYQVTPNDAFISREELMELLMGDSGELPVFGKSKESLFSILFSADGTFSPKSSIGNLTSMEYPISEQLTRRQQSYTYRSRYMGSFQVDIYIHPQNVELEINSESFRKKYLANIGVYWGSRSMSHGSMALLNVNINDAAQDLFKNFDGETWVMSINVTRL